MARFLAFLSTDAAEAGHLYTRLHGKLVEFFTTKGLSDPLSAADETLDRAALKISEGAAVPSLSNFCLGIARNVFKEKYRRGQREQSTFIEFTQNLANPSPPRGDRIYLLLKPCFELLPERDRQLLLSYCQTLQGRARIECRRRLAESLGITPLALRLRVKRLRIGLAQCVKQRAGSPPKVMGNLL